jgi:hypothetical protein
MMVCCRSASGLLRGKGLSLPFVSLFGRESLPHTTNSLQQKPHPLPPPQNALFLSSSISHKSTSSALFTLTHPHRTHTTHTHTSLTSTRERERKRKREKHTKRKKNISMQQTLARRAGSAMPYLAPRTARRPAVSVSAAQQKATVVSVCVRLRFFPWTRGKRERDAPLRPALAPLAGQGAVVVAT